MSEQVWNNETISVDGTRCGTKTYNNLRNRDSDELFYCIRETVVRIFLKGTNTEQFVTKLEAVRPQKFYDYLLKIPLEDIQNKFFEVCSDVQRYIISEKIETVELLIEKGEATVRDVVTNEAFNTDKQKVESMIQDIFSVLNKLHRVGVVHADIKPENFLFCKRAKIKTLVLNDFDTSFMIPENSTYINLSDKSDIIKATPRYAAPEQYGVGGYIIGFHTDVFSASMIAYTMLNGNKHPEQYHILDGASKYDRHQKVKKLFTDMKKNGTEFEQCESGNPQLKEYISKGLRINPNERPSALKIASVAKEVEPIEIPPTQKTTERESIIKSEIETKPKQTEEEKNIVNKYENHDDHSTNDNHSNHGAVIIAIVAIIALAIVILGLVALIKLNGGDTNMNVSVSANKPEISTEYITTLSSAATTEEETDTIQTETEKKTILLQQL